MRLGLLSVNPKNYTARRLREAAQARGHKIRTLDPLEMSVFVERGRPTLTYKTKRLERLDAVIPRIGAAITHFGTAVVQQFEEAGVYCLNPASAIRIARDKLRSIQALSRHEVGFPPTAFVRSKAAIPAAIESVGGVPVVIKLLEGTQGTGVILAETTQVAEAILETLQTLAAPVLVQRFVAESRGKDIRALVVGHEVVAAMRRTAQGDEFRSNVHRGGSVEAVTLSPDDARVAVRAAQVLGLRLAGVDMLESHTGPQVMEVNSSPGLEGIEAASGQDLAGKIVEYLEHAAEIPDIDIRQRLTAPPGYGVAEVHASAGSALVGQTLRALGVDGDPIRVLCVRRGPEVTPNPEGDHTVRADDTLVCFGPLTALRGLLPSRS